MTSIAGLLDHSMAKFQALTDSTISKRNLNETLIQSICFLFRVELWQSIASLAVVFPQFGHTSNQLLSSLCTKLVY